MKVSSNYLLNQSLFIKQLREKYPLENMRLIFKNNKVIIYIFTYNHFEKNEIDIINSFICNIKKKSNNTYVLVFSSRFRMIYEETIVLDKNKQYSKGPKK